GPAGGRLSYHEGPRVQNIGTEQQAHELIESDRRNQGAGGQQVVYVFRYPRDPSSAFPKVTQRKDYERWFKDVPTSWDYLGANPTGGGPPSAPSCPSPTASSLPTTPASKS